MHKCASLFKKKSIYYKLFLCQNMVGETCDMHESASQGLKRTFMHVSVLRQAYFAEKIILVNEKNFFYKNGGKRHEKCIYVRCRA